MPKVNVEIALWIVLGIATLVAIVLRFGFDAGVLGGMMFALGVLAGISFISHILTGKDTN